MEKSYIIGKYSKGSWPVYLREGRVSIGTITGDGVRKGYIAMDVEGKERYERLQHHACLWLVERSKIK